MLGGEVGERVHPARGESAGGQVEAGPVGVERIDQLVDPLRRRERGDGDDGRVAGAERAQRGAEVG